MAGYLLTFDPQVWAMLFFLLVFLSIVMASLGAIARRMRRESASVLKLWNQHFWQLFENMFCEASAETPERTDLRIISAVWWIAIVVLMNAFAGQMRACLMVKSELKRINTLADIAERPDLKVYALKNTVATRYLEAGKFCAGGEPGEFYYGTEVMYTLIFAGYMNRQMNETLRKRIKRM
ncbi:hypothetical protein MTO96_017417 [Rhipicephalus appendiculatus]